MSKQNNGLTLFKSGTIVTMDPKVPKSLNWRCASRR
jgi:hypothetical protein